MDKLKRVDIKGKQQCSGCSLCAEICPKSAITMETDCDGFVYPSIDNDLCVYCGVCYSKCSFKNQHQGSNPDIYIGRSKDNNILMNSASGGIFTILSDSILDLSGVVYGAVYDSRFSVKHINAYDKETRNLMRDSKYVQSSMLGVFSQIEHNLKDNKIVLFSGTPCQCSAVNEFIRIKRLNRSNLLLVDVICHGVGSPKVWRDYLKYISDKCSLNGITSIKIRNKEKGSGYNMTINSNSGFYQRSGVLDPYICLFNKMLIFRKSCYSCPFKSWRRISDITIGDFQKVRQYFPNFADGKGVSVLIANSEYGKEFLKSQLYKLDWEKADKERASQVNLSGILLDDSRRNAFFKYYNLNGVEKALFRYSNEVFYKRLLYYVKSYLVKLFHVIK